jgi:hypothetical protein
MILYAAILLFFNIVKISQRYFAKNVARALNLAENLYIIFSLVPSIMNLFISITCAMTYCDNISIYISSKEYSEYKFSICGRHTGEYVIMNKGVFVFPYTELIRRD